MSITKKEFALNAIKPYYDDPSICGYNTKTGQCSYLTSEGLMCVAGKYLLHPEDFKTFESIASLLHDAKQDDIFKPEAANILDKAEWQALQHIHDSIAQNKPEQIKRAIDTLDLFTLDELESYQLK